MTGELDRAGVLPDLSRRQFLTRTGGAVTAVAAVKAAHNTILGYGDLMGTNLREQELRPLLVENLGLDYDEAVAGTAVRLDDGGILVEAAGGSERLDLVDDSAGDARELDADLGLDGRLVALFADVRAFRDGSYAFEFFQPSAFFDRVAGATARPDLVAALRNGRDRTVDPSDVEAFAEVDPSDVEALLYGMMAGLREKTNYDIPRYVAGSVEDNVVFGAVELRSYFAEPVDFEALAANDETGIFCYELVHRSREALQSVAPWRQSVPVAACFVLDRWHKHAYTGITTAIRDDGDLRLPTTFVDYTYSTLYDDLHLTDIRGEGLAAYDTHHVADEIYW